MTGENSHDGERYPIGGAQRTQHLERAHQLGLLGLAARFAGDVWV